MKNFKIYKISFDFRKIEVKEMEVREREREQEKQREQIRKDDK